MTRSVFLAYPLTSAGDLGQFEGIVLHLRRRLVGAGFLVMPEIGGPGRVALEGGLAASDRLASNVGGVTGCDVLVVLLPELEEPSSIWVELGMALAAGRRVVVAGPESARLPYLARLAVEAGADRVVGDFRPADAGQTVVEEIVRAIRSDDR